MNTSAPSVIEAIDAPDDVAAWAVAHGPTDSSLLPLLTAVRTGRLGDEGRVNALVALAKSRAMIEAVELALVAQMDRADDSGKEWVREDIAAALRISPPAPPTDFGSRVISCASRKPTSCSRRARSR